MKLLNFINQHSDWREILTNAPYNLIIKDDEPYFLLKYDMLNSDMSDPLVQEARGCIFRFDKEKDCYICVCHPFNKFFNAQENNAAEIDWDSAVIYEKIDGSLIKFWYDLDEWHISTNSTIDAAKAEVESYDGHITFYDLVCSCFKDEKTMDEFFKYLSVDFTFMFELVSPYNRLVVPYEKTELYFIGSRCMINDKEGIINDDSKWFCNMFNIKLPKIYQFKSIDDVLDAAASLSKLNEGFVVCDRYFNRIKIKGAEYLRAFRIRGNDKITQKKVVKAILDGYIDDMIGFFGDMPEIQKTINDFKFVEQAFEVSRAAMENYIRAYQLEDRKAIAEYVKQLGDAQGYCFAALKNPEITAFEYLKKISVDKVLMLME